MGNLGIGIGVGVGLNRANFSWSAYWTTPNKSDQLFSLSGRVIEDGGSYYLKDESTNGRNFLITNYDWSEDYFNVDPQVFPFKTKATITAPAGDAVLIAADTGNFFYDAGGTPIARRPQDFFQNVNYANIIYCREVDHTIIPLDYADVSLQGVELTPSGVKDIVMYSSARTGTDITTCDAYFSVPAKNVANGIFVAKDGNDGTGNGTEALPYLTINKAVTIVAGTTGTKIIYIKQGAYIEDSGSGYLQIKITTGTHNITFQGLGGVSMTGTGAGDRTFNILNDAYSAPTLTYAISNMSITSNRRYGIIASSASGTMTVNINKLYYFSNAGNTYNTLYEGLGVVYNVNNSCVRSNGGESYYYQRGYVINSFFNHINRIAVDDGDYFRYNKFDAETTTRINLLAGNNPAYDLNDKFYVEYNIFYYGRLAFDCRVNTNTGYNYVNHNVFRRKYLNTAGVDAFQTFSGGTPAPQNITFTYNYFEDLTDQDIPANSTVVEIKGLVGGTFDIQNNNIKTSTAYARNGIIVTLTAQCGAGSKFNDNHYESESIVGIGLGTSEGGDSYFVGVEVIGNYFRGYRLNNPSDVGATIHALLIRGQDCIVENNFISHSQAGFVVKSIGIVNTTATFRNNIAWNCCTPFTARGYNNVTVNNCTFTSKNSASYFIALYDQLGSETENIDFVNCIFSKTGTYGATHIAMNTASFANVKFYNCVMQMPDLANLFYDLQLTSYDSYSDAVTGGYAIDNQTLVDPSFTNETSGQLWPTMKLNYGKDISQDTRLAITSNWNYQNEKSFYLPSISTIEDNDVIKQCGAYGL